MPFLLKTDRQARASPAARDVPRATPPEAPDAMLAPALLAAVLFGVTLQVAAVARVGGRIALTRFTRWRSTSRPSSKNSARRPAEPPPPAQPLRRHCRDYRTALRAAKA